MKYNRIFILLIVLIAAITAITTTANARNVILSDDFSDYDIWTTYKDGGGVYEINGVQYGGDLTNYPGKAYIDFTWCTEAQHGGFKPTWNFSTDDVDLYFGVFDSPTLTTNGQVAFTNGNWKVKLTCTNSQNNQYTINLYVGGVEKASATGKYFGTDLEIIVNNGNMTVKSSDTVMCSATNTGASSSKNTQLDVYAYATTNNGQGMDYYFDNFTYYSEQSLTSDTTFNGYVKDDNGNPLQYCNVTLWKGNAYGTYVNSNVTDANGYYTFGPSTVDSGALYNMSVKPPNSYYTNLYGFAANDTTPLTLNFTVNPARMQIYAYDASKGIADGDLNAVNFTVTVSGAGIPDPGIVYHKIEHDSPYIFDEEIPTGATVSILANKTGFVDKYNNFTSVAGWNTPAIAMSGDYSSGGYVLILGHVRDNTGTKLTGIPVYLVRADTNATVSAAVSSNNLLVDPGYYALRVPISAVDYQYKIIGTFPGYGNLTCDLRQGGATGDIGVNDIITYDATWTAEGLAANAQMGVDPWFSLPGTYTPSVTPTPSPGGSIPNAPGGYNIIGGQVYNVATGQNIPSVPVYFCYQNGTLISSTTTDASGAYSFTFATAGMGTQSLIVKPGNTAQFLNTTSTTYINYPFAGGATSFRNDIGMTAVAGYQTYKMSGYLYDAVKGENYHVSGGTVSIWTQDGNTQITIVSVNGGGYYEIYLGQDLTPTTYIVSAASVGYTNNNATFPFPGAFAGDGMYNLSLAMQPTIISDDNNNALGIQITDNTTGLILNNAQYVIKYADNNTVYASGGMGGQYVVYLYNLPAEDYLITGSYTGYTSLTYGKTIAANNWYSINIGLNPIVTPTAIPTATPTPSGVPTMYTNPFEALIHLLVLAGLDESTANIMVGFLFIIGGAAAMAIIGAKIGLIGNVGMPMLMGIGAASGFALACLTGVWPIWLLLVGAFLVVIYVVYAFVAPKGGA